MTLVVLGLVTNAAAVARYSHIRKALTELGTVVPNPMLAYVLGAGSVLVAIAMAIMLATTLAD